MPRFGSMRSSLAKKTARAKAARQEMRTQVSKFPVRALFTSLRGTTPLIQRVGEAEHALEKTKKFRASKLGKAIRIGTSPRLALRLAGPKRK